MRKVLVADDDRIFTDTLCDTLRHDGCYEVVAKLHDGGDAIAQIQALRPDIVILDILMPGSDGIHIVDYIRSQMEGYRPIIYILSGIGTRRIMRLLNTMDVDFFSLKPVPVEQVTRNLKSIERYGEDWPEDDLVAAEENVMPAVIFNTALSEQERRQHVEQLIIKLGLLPHRKSAKCLIDALLYCGEDPERIELITKLLYPDVAKKNQISACAVERNIRRAIEMMQASRTPIFQQIFAHFPSKRMTNSEFLAVVTDYLSFQRM